MPCDTECIFSRFHRRTVPEGDKDMRLWKKVDVCTQCEVTVRSTGVLSCTDEMKAECVEEGLLQYDPFECAEADAANTRSNGKARHNFDMYLTVANQQINEERKRRVGSGDPVGDRKGKKKAVINRAKELVLALVAGAQSTPNPWEIIQEAGERMIGAVKLGTNMQNADRRLGECESSCIDHEEFHKKLMASREATGQYDDAKDNRISTTNPP